MKDRKCLALSLVGLACLVFVTIAVCIMMANVADGRTVRSNGIAEALAAWQADYEGDFWLWGLAAIDYNGDGLDDLCVTAHNGGSVVLENNGDGTWEWVEIGNGLGGTFRPVVFDFDGDGDPDLLYRDSLPNTAYRNTGEGFANVGFAYGTGNDPVRYFGVGWFGHDWGLWTWTGQTFAHQSYTNPNYAKLPPPIKAKLDAELGKQFFRAWFTDADVISVSGFWTYHKAPNFCHFLRPSRHGKLADVSAKLGLPTTGAVVYHEPGVILITGHGLYVQNGNAYQKVPGALTDFLADVPDWAHQCFRAGDRIAVSNVRGQKVKIFKWGTWQLLSDLGSWDGEAVCVMADGTIAVGSGGTVVFK